MTGRAPPLPGPQSGLDGLPTLERRVLGVISVFYEAVSRTALIRAFKALAMRAPSGRPLDAAAVEPILERLEILSFLTRRDGAIRCLPACVEGATRRMVADGMLVAVTEVVRTMAPLKPRGRSRRFRTYGQAVREIRLALYLGDPARVDEEVRACEGQFPGICRARHPFVAIASRPFDARWLETIQAGLRCAILDHVLDHAARHLEPASEALEVAGGLAGPGTPALAATLAFQELLRGRLEQAAARVAGLPGPAPAGVASLVELVSGRIETAIAGFERARAGQGPARTRKGLGLAGPVGLFHVVALLATGRPDRIEQASVLIEKAAEDPFDPCHEAVRALGALAARPVAPPGPAAVESPVAGPPGFLVPVTRALVAVAQGRAPAQREDRVELWELKEKARAGGYAWVAGQIEALLDHRPDDPVPGAARRGSTAGPAAGRPAGRRDPGPAAVPPVVRILDLLPRQEAWERSLDALARLGAEAARPASGPADVRLAWFVTSREGHVELEPREQRRSERGEWSRGRPVSLERLHKSADQMPHLTGQDVALAGSITVHRMAGWARRFGRVSHVFDLDRALPALVGHPLVFRDGEPPRRVEVVAGQPQLLAVRDRDGLRLSFAPEPGLWTGSVVVEELPESLLRVTEITDGHRQIARLVGGGLAVPVGERDRVLGTLASLAPLITVHADIGGAIEDVTEVDADPRPHLHLIPYGEGLKIRVWVRPFASEGPLFRPGGGGPTVIAEIGGHRLQTIRDLEEETRRVREMTRRLGPLEEDGDDDPREWILPEVERCLELLEDLERLGEEVVVKWPEGRPFRIAATVGPESLDLGIRRQRDWFEATGSLALGPDRRVDLARLIDDLQRARGRFVPLSEGEFVALTREFQRRLELFAACAETGDGVVRFPALAAPVAEELAGAAGRIEADEEWTARCERIRAARDQDAEVPAAFEADLRPYQLDGFRWLCRLAQWGVGACLADDMGLGKTVQTLALILHRAAAGPSLVVAPTTVCANWIAEATRFAPSLRVQTYGGARRDELLDALGPFDLVVVSYGRLQQDVDRLSPVRWETVVLDEAQAIKNAATQRSRAVMELFGRFKVITTGTPIENHLGELWNLMRFVNPGLLGSLEAFNARFVVPIEKYGDAPRRNRLRRLIQPFVLRRTKTQVLDDLPPRTEIDLGVELSPEERTLYEALRRKALEMLESFEETRPGEKRLRMLTEILKLRQACCHPRLVAPDTPLGSSKLLVFGQILEDLLENRHRALVFSQFVTHLSILREDLDRRHIRYQYLDGSLPEANRRRAVEAFQAGEGDLFLISLRAGGFGLNLTAADYVIHMDPWWNPAVEDQASDRAHRIGQRRPVTVYRLIARDTIEETIVDLHRHKRDLARELLAGADTPGRMSGDQLMDLIRGG